MIAYSQKYEVKINIFRNETRKSYEKEISSNSYESPSFQSRYSFYDGAKHERDYLYPMTREVMGSWKHFNLSKNTLAERHRRETSPLVSRELDRLVSPRRLFFLCGNLWLTCIDAKASLAVSLLVLSRLSSVTEC